MEMADRTSWAGGLDGFRQRSAELTAAWLNHWTIRNPSFASPPNFCEDGPFDPANFLIQRRRIVFVAKEAYWIRGGSTVKWWTENLQAAPQSYRHPHRTSDVLRRLIEGILDDTTYSDTAIANSIQPCIWSKRWIDATSRVSWINIKKQDDGNRQSRITDIRRFAKLDAPLIARQIRLLSPHVLIFFCDGGSVDYVVKELFTNADSLNWVPVRRAKGSPWTTVAGNIRLVHALHPQQSRYDKRDMFEWLVEASMRPT